MTDTVGTESWRGIQPITSIFRPEALPEVYTSNAPTDDERDEKVGLGADYVETLVR